MRIIQPSDIHLGDYSYGHVDPTTGLGTRLLDFLDNLQQSIDYAISNKADLFIIPGDIYRIKNPSSKIRKCFAEKMKVLLAAGIRTIVLTGNHDMAISQGNSHALSELEEVSDFIEGLEVYSSPTIIRIKDTELYLLPFVNRGHHNLATADDLNRFHVEKVKEFNQLSQNSNAKYKIFYGHFGTDQSTIGGSFDLDMSDDANELVVRLALFEEGDWTKVYLGHIHKHQEFNSVVRHIGSLSRVDFAEEEEQKGFYDYIDGNDEFIHVDDREFKTYNIDLRAHHHERLNRFAADLKRTDLTQTIVRVNVTMRQTHVPEIRLEPVIDYLKKNCWYSTGIETALVQDEEEEVGAEHQITNVDQPGVALRKFMEKNPGRFEGIEDRVMAAGAVILAELKKI